MGAMHSVVTVLLRILCFGGDGKQQGDSSIVGTFGGGRGDGLGQMLKVFDGVVLAQGQH